MEEELEYLQWFASHADFGPAHMDVMIWLQDQYEAKTGKRVPEGYRYRDDIDEEDNG